jgi:curved DNA-binding protein CbpA
MMVLILLSLLLMPSASAAKGAPDVSSTALKMHKLYLSQPPHDISLYTTLKVSPNATAAQITKSYRHFSREYHPDKQQHSRNDHQQKLQEVQQAYEILKDDTTRLPYHKYGFTDPNVAIILLMRPAARRSRAGGHPASLDSLLQLMGLEHFSSLPKTKTRTALSPEAMHQLRVRIVAARLVEQIRPLVEETIQPGIVAHAIAKQCDEWKVLPLGAQIVRCVGRAYRHSGQDYLHSGKVGISDVSVAARQRWRRTKGFWTAVLAAGRASVTEKVWTVQQQRRRRLKQQQGKSHLSLEYHSLGEGGEFLDPDYILSEDALLGDLEEEEEMKQSQRLKAQQTLLHSLQVEALWKITKIDLDKTIRAACNLILNGDYFFFPSDQWAFQQESRNEDGWISGSTGKTIYAREARTKAAEAMRMIGNIMVQRSKDGTAWKE